MTSDCHRPGSEVGQVTSAFGGTPGADLNIPQNKAVMQRGSYREPVAAPKHEQNMVPWCQPQGHPSSDSQALAFRHALYVDKVSRAWPQTV